MPPEIDTLIEAFEQAWKTAGNSPAKIPDWRDFIAHANSEDALHYVIEMDIEQRVRLDLPGVIEQRYWEYPALRNRLSDEQKIALIRNEVIRRNRNKIFDANERETPVAEINAKTRAERYAATFPNLAEHPFWNAIPWIPTGLNAVPNQANDQAASKSNCRVNQTAAGQLVGPYKLLKKLGVGGMGEVWMAEQHQPLRRTVALKLIKQNISGSHQIVARFEAERRVLSLMNHPNIARILDSGMTDDGQPYFVMELVSGQPLNEYCDQQSLSIEERLKLFIDVCIGVQHAHQKGIIHRDLKPSNILITQMDGIAIPKIIDFGLAKVLQDDPPWLDPTLITAMGQILGTLKYMSPEQAGLNHLDIDTRSDIYALGVILYELLTGSTPLDNDSLHEKTFIQLLELVRNQEPPRPSSRIGKVKSTVLVAISARRKIGTVRLERILLRDLDWVVMKALDKDRSRRYDSAAGMAADVNRYLLGEPVVARPSSLMYRLRKFSRKHRLVVTAASLIALSLLGGSIGTTLGLRQARQAERAAQEEKRRADEKADIAFKANSIITKLFEGLDPYSDFQTLPDLRDGLTRDLENVIAAVDNSVTGGPLERATLLETLCRAILGLGKAKEYLHVFQEVKNLRETHLGPDHRETLASQCNLAFAYSQAGAPDKAAELYRQVLVQMTSLFGEKDPGTLTIMNNLAQTYTHLKKFNEAVELQSKVLNIQILANGPSAPESLMSAGNLAGIYTKMGQPEKAIPMLLETVRSSQETLGENNLLTLERIGNLGKAYLEAGQPELAIPLLEQNADKFRNKLGYNHRFTLQLTINLADAYAATGQTKKAISLYEPALEIAKKVFGENDQDSMNLMNNLAVAYQENRQLQEASQLFEQTLAITITNFGMESEETLISLLNLAVTCKQSKDLEKTATTYERALPLMKKFFGVENPKTLAVMSQVAGTYWQLSKFDKSIPILEELLTIQETTLGKENPKTFATLVNLAINYKDSGRVNDAIPILERVVSANQEQANALGAQDPLLECYVNANRPESFEKLAASELAFARSEFATQPTELVAKLFLIAKGYVRLQLWEHAEPVLRETIALGQKVNPDLWINFQARSILGEVLLKKGNLTEAELHLVAGHEGLQARSNSLNSRNQQIIPEAIDRLLNLYSQQGECEALAKYQDLKDKAFATSQKK